MTFLEKRSGELEYEEFSFIGKVSAQFSHQISKIPAYEGKSYEKSETCALGVIIILLRTVPIPINSAGKEIWKKWFRTN